jgi:hypothetical protein
MDYKKFDRAGDMWKIDKDRKRILREKDAQIIERVTEQGFFSKYAAGDKVILERCMQLDDAVIEKVVSADTYRVKLASGDVVDATEADILEQEIPW